MASALCRVFPNRNLLHITAGTRCHVYGFRLHSTVHLWLTGVRHLILCAENERTCRPYIVFNIAHCVRCEAQRPISPFKTLSPPTNVKYLNVSQHHISSRCSIRTLNRRRSQTKTFITTPQSRLD